ncbi:hypothetical protein MICRO80W_830025 [Micrococcus luteus]|nr:hypothetical protein MICRO80W_830025 [Micrococcus luteus]
MPRCLQRPGFRSGVRTQRALRLGHECRPISPGGVRADHEPHDRSRGMTEGATYTLRAYVPQTTKPPPEPASEGIHRYDTTAIGSP